jgi:hypothetical protein
VLAPRLFSSRRRTCTGACRAQQESASFLKRHFTKTNSYGWVCTVHQSDLTTKNVKMNKKIKLTKPEPHYIVDIDLIALLEYIPLQHDVQPWRWRCASEPSAVPQGFTRQSASTFQTCFVQPRYHWQLDSRQDQAVHHQLP